MHRRKIGLMGGTFDPIHNAHLALGEVAQKQLELDEVWFLPAGAPYLDKHSQITDAELRGMMVSLGIMDHQNFKMSDVELYEKGRTYTVETMERLNHDYSDTDFYFLIGTDQLFGIERWYRADRLLKICKIAVAGRNYPKQNRTLEEQVAYLKEKYEADIALLDFPEMDISSTDIRKMVKNSEDISALVPKRVCEFILKKNLYK